MSADRDDKSTDQRASIGTHAAAAGGQVAASPMPGAVEPVELAMDDLLPMAIPSSGRKGVGRPAGSANVRTNKTFQAAISRYGDPLIASIAWGNMGTADLIREMRIIASDCGIKLGATVMDVVRFQEQCRATALPYGHAKRAPTNEKGEDVLPIFVMGGGSGSTTNVQINAGGMSIEDRIEAERIAELNQIDSGVDADVSQEEKSHDD